MSVRQRNIVRAIIRPANTQARRWAGYVQRNLSRALCLWLTITLLATSTPAAPKIIVGVASEWHVSTLFWLRTSGRVATMMSFLSAQGQSGGNHQEKQEERSARVSHIQIHPGDLTIRVGERVVFAAVAYDRNDTPVGGINFNWKCREEDRNLAIRITPEGEFIATAAGNFKIIVEGAGQRAHVRVKVIEGVRPDHNEQPTRIIPVSSRDVPSATSALPRKKYEQRTAHANRSSLLPAPMVQMLPTDGWDQNNSHTADDPGNRVGNPPGSAMDGGAGSGNFQLIAPVTGLPGRGIDLALGLAYNSRLWNKADPEITYDIDRGWPAPGWSFGFGKILGMGVYKGSMIVEPDGTRRGYKGSVTEYSSGTTFVGQTTDGSFIDYTHNTGFNGVLTYAEAKYPNGTVIKYSTQGAGALYPTLITDAHGNYIKITYHNSTNTGPEIETITDTLGRTINFHYDANNLLTAITAPPLTDSYSNPDPNPQRRELVRLHYRQLTLNAAFSGLTPRVRNASPWVIDAIYYPATATGYWFGDSDSYSSYGMIAKVVEQRGMGFSASSLNDQGTVTPGSMTRQSVYSYDLGPNSSLRDAPTYQTMTETWEGMDTAPAVTTYNFQQEATPRRVEVTQPNGVKSVQLSYNFTSLPDNHPDKFKDGLVYQDETYDASGALIGSSSSAWEKGAYDAPRPTRVEVTDDRLQKKAAAFSYGSVYNQVIEVRDLDYGGQTLLRKTVTAYENSANYTNRHIFNLVKQVEIYDGDGITRVSRTDYEYDNATLADTPGVVNYDRTFNPHAPDEQSEQCEQIDQGVYHCQLVMTNPYDPATAYRGNVTKVTTYSDAAPSTPTGAVPEYRRYDITGNLITASNACCEQASFTYTANTKYAYTESTTRGSVDQSSPLQVSSEATYDFNTGLVLTGTDANGRTSRIIYYPASLREKESISPTGAKTVFVYDDSSLTVNETTYTASSEGGSIATRNEKFLNGRGEVRQEKALGKDGVWDMVDTAYDVLGRVWKQTRPYRSGEQQRWHETSYDALGRVKSVKAPDGSETKAFYNETSYPGVATPGVPGQTTRTVDAWGRERWGRKDAQGRLVEVVEPNPLGSGSVFGPGSLLTQYSYDTMGNLLEVIQGVQQRRFRYDSLNRLTQQKLAETAATLNDQGQYVGAGGQWSDVFTYDVRSNMISRVDARGVKTLFSYKDSAGNDDPLNRLRSVSYDTTADPLQSDPHRKVLPAATVTYDYMTSGDVTRLWKVSAAGVSTDEYDYDIEGRIKDRTVTMQSRTAYPMVTSYTYDSLDRVKDVRYPAQYGVTGAPRKLVHHDYDAASRLSSLQVNGVEYASQIDYNAASQSKSLKVGASGANQVTEDYDYDAQTGLLTRQKVLRGTGASATTLLDLSYDYLRANTGAGRTGHLTRLTNNLDANKSRGYEYDALGRLVKVTGGPASAPSPLWTQIYAYDRFGNRESVTATGNTAGVSMTAPGNLLTTSVGNSQVTLQWTESTGAHHYEIERLQSLSAGYQVVDTSATPAFTDSSVESGKAYVYRVRAVDAAGNRSEPSNLRLATAMTFTDATLESNVTLIKAQHVLELRQAVNAVRRAANQPDATWTDAQLSSVAIKAAHIAELRSKLNEALLALGFTAPSYTDPALTGVTIKRVHFEQLRSAVNLGGASSGGGSSSSAPVPRDGHASLSYDAATNRINVAGWEYDTSGNQTRVQLASGAWQRYQYDAASRLIHVRADNQQILSTSTYGPTNERLISDEAGLRTYYACSGGAVIAEYAESGAQTSPQWMKSYIYLGARLLSTITPSGTAEYVQYHHPDRLGTRLVTNSSDTTHFEQVTLPYGVALGAESSGATNRRFTSYDRSSITGLDYAVNRHYDSQQGRFTQVDPIEMEAVDLDDPQSLNLYAYCGNDPINHVDPEGLFFGKLWRAIKKIFTSKWFVIAATVALAVIGFGAAVGLWSLSTPVFAELGSGILIATGATQATALGWVATGIAAALAIPTIDFSVQSLLRNAAGLGLAGGSFGAVGGTPDWNPNAHDFLQGRKDKKPPPRGRQPGGWNFGLGRPPRPPRRYSPIPGSYMNGPRIDMRNAPAGSKTNAAGHPRNSEWFWRQMLEEHPEMFSPNNRARINARRSPTIDYVWVQHNPAMGGFMGDTLIHHHINQGPIATPIPQRVHRMWHGTLHPNR